MFLSIATISATSIRLSNGLQLLSSETLPDGQCFQNECKPEPCKDQGQSVCNPWNGSYMPQPICDNPYADFLSTIIQQTNTLAESLNAAKMNYLNCAVCTLKANLVSFSLPSNSAALQTIVQGLVTSKIITADQAAYLNKYLLEADSQALTSATTCFKKSVEGTFNELLSCDCSLKDSISNETMFSIVATDLSQAINGAQCCFSFDGMKQAYLNAFAKAGIDVSPFIGDLETELNKIITATVAAADAAVTAFETAVSTAITTKCEAALKSSQERLISTYEQVVNDTIARLQALTGETTPVVPPTTFKSILPKGFNPFSGVGRTARKAASKQVVTDDELDTDDEELLKRFKNLKKKMDSEKKKTQIITPVESPAVTDDEEEN